MHFSTKSSLLSLCAAFVLAGCASQPVSRPILSIHQLSGSTEMRIESQSGTPVEYRITIENPSDEPVTLLSVELESLGRSGGYLLPKVKRIFSHVIPAKSSDKVNFRAWVQPLSRDLSGRMTGAVMLRGSARFQTSAGIVRSTFSGDNR